MKMRYGMAPCLLVCASCWPAFSQPFVTPIGGTPYEDWTIVNYVDLDPGGQGADFRGGGYTYNGHNAIDFTLPNFAAMDAGVAVLAAADGVVTRTHDGEFDRCSRVAPCGNRPNYIVIDHGDGVVTEYLHLKTGSLAVALGERVAAGQTIAEVGSSGLSSDAHLHFAVYDQGRVVETYEAPETWWLNPLPYAGDVFGSLDHGIVDHSPTLAELVDRPIDHDVFLQSAGAGQEAVLWTHLHGIDAGDDLDAFFLQPDGTEYAHWHWTANQIRYGWWLASIALPPVPDVGAWTIDFQLNQSTLIADSFDVAGSEPADCSGDWMLSAADLSCVNTVPERDAVLTALDALAGDLDGNGEVAFADFLVLSQHFGEDSSSYTDGNVDLQGGVDVADFLVLADNFGKTRAAAIAAPEPTGTLSLWLGLGLTLMVAIPRRGRRC